MGTPTTPCDIQPDSEVEAVAQSHIIEHPNTHLNANEHKLLTELLQPGAKIEVIIPPDTPAKELWNVLDTCVKGVNVLDARAMRAHIVVGKFLVWFEKQPSLYKDLGYRTFSDFMKKGVYGKMGYKSTTAYISKMVATNWPQVTPDRYAANLGPKKMAILNAAGVTGRDSKAEEWLRAAESMPVKSLKQYVEVRGGPTRAETTGATIIIPTSLEIYKRFMGFIGDGRIQSVCGSKDPGKILWHVMEEFFDQWVQQAEENRRQEQNEASTRISL